MGQKIISRDIRGTLSKVFVSMDTYYTGVGVIEKGMIYCFLMERQEKPTDMTPSSLASFSAIENCSLEEGKKKKNWTKDHDVGGTEECEFGSPDTWHGVR